MFILPHGIWKDNIRSVILDWKQRSSGHSNEGERSASLSSEERVPLVTQADLPAPCVCSQAVALLHKKGPCHRRKICANSLWLYSYYTQSLPSKNKNMNYIFIHLRVFRCLSSSAIWDTFIKRFLLIFGLMVEVFKREFLDLIFWWKHKHSAIRKQNLAFLELPDSVLYQYCQVMSTAWISLAISHYRPLLLVSPLDLNKPCANK